MKKIIFFAATVATMVFMSGCVNEALLKSSQAYYDSTKPYIEMAIENKSMSKEEVDSVKLNMNQFKKTLDHYAANKAWYEL